ncbi:MAG: STAS/SEC14 domain-containing protein [Pontibacterium sp.]
MLYVLPETAGDILVVQATGTLSSEDYQDTFIPLLTEKIESHGAVRVLLYLDHGFTGFEAGALWQDVTFGLKHREDFLRIAVVGDQQWIDWITRVGTACISGESRHFTASQFLQALHWIDGSNEV